MAIKFNLKETIKTFILAPAIAGITFMVTKIMVNIANGSGFSILSNNNASYYPLAVAGLVFVLVIIMGLDDIISDIKSPDQNKSQ